MPALNRRVAAQSLRHVGNRLTLCETQTPNGIVFSPEKLVSLRPYVYRLTANGNVRRIVRSRRLESAKRLLESSNRTDLIRAKRPSSVKVQIGSETIHIRDQAPLF